jgi:hypothetical protein
VISILWIEMISLADCEGKGFEQEETEITEEL